MRLIKVIDGVLTVATVSLLMYGCSTGSLNSSLSQQSAAINSTAQSIGDHVNNAAGSVKDATDIAKGIPAAAPVLPPLGTAANELAAAQDQVKLLQGQVSAGADQVMKLISKNEQLTTDNADLTTQWNSSWLGGRSWFWIHLIEISVVVIFFALFAAEFFLGWNIHPLTWILTAAPIVGKIAVNATKAAISGVKSAATYVIGWFKPKPAATPATPSVTAVAPVAKATVVATHQG